MPDRAHAALEARSVGLFELAFVAIMPEDIYMELSERHEPLPLKSFAPMGREPPTSPAFAATGAVAWIFVGCNRLWEDNTEASKMCTIAIATALANDGLRVRAVPILATMDRARAWGVETGGSNNQLGMGQGCGMERDGPA